MVKVPTVKECMADWWVTLRADMNILEAADLLFSKRSAGAPVLDDAGELVGILTEKDCLRLLSNTTYMTSRIEELPGGVVGDYMSEVKQAVDIGDDLFAAAKKFLATNFAVLPVMDHGRTVGRISRQDMLRGIQRLQREIVRARAKEECLLHTLAAPRSIGDLQQLASTASPSQMAAVLSQRHGDR